MTGHTLGILFSLAHFFDLTFWMTAHLSLTSHFHNSCPISVHSEHPYQKSNSISGKLVACWRKLQKKIIPEFFLLLYHKFFWHSISVHIHFLFGFCICLHLLVNFYKLCNLQLSRFHKKVSTRKQQQRHADYYQHKFHDSKTGR